LVLYPHLFFSFPTQALAVLKTTFPQIFFLHPFPVLRCSETHLPANPSFLFNPFLSVFLNDFINPWMLLLNFHRVLRGGITISEHNIGYKAGSAERLNPSKPMLQ